MKSSYITGILMVEVATKKSIKLPDFITVTLKDAGGVKFKFDCTSKDNVYYLSEFNYKNMIICGNIKLNLKNNSVHPMFCQNNKTAKFDSRDACLLDTLDSQNISKAVSEAWSEIYIPKFQ